MSALITQTIDEELRVLLVAQQSATALLLHEHITQRGFEVTVVLPSQLSKTDDVFQQQWYKVIYFIESGAGLEWLELPLQSFAPQSIVIFPLTPAVSFNTPELMGWQTATDNEKKTLRQFIKHIDISRFFFYSCLLDSQSYPLKAILGKIHQGVLLDPQIPLTSFTPSALVSTLSEMVFRPQSSPVKLVGQLRSSQDIVTVMRDMYERYFQKSLRVQLLSVVSEVHPAISTIAQPMSEQIIKEPLRQVVQPIVSALPLVDEPVLEESYLENVDMVEPDITQQLPVWNQVANSVKNMVDQSIESIQETIVGSRLKTTVDLSESIPQTLDQEVIEGDDSLEDSTDGQGSAETVVKEKLKANLNSLFSTYRSQQKQTHLTDLVNQTNRGKKKLRSHKALFGGGLVIAGVAMGVLALFSLLSIQGRRLNGQLTNYILSLSQPITAQEKNLAELSSTHSWVSRQLTFLSTTLSLPLFPQLSSRSELVGNVIMVHDLQSQLHAQQGIVWKSLTGREGDAFKALSDFHQQADTTYKTAAILSAQLKDFSQETSAPSEKEQLAVYEESLKTNQQSLEKFQQLYPLLPGLLGAEEARTYAILLQNEQELRPTGGFIQSVALVSVHNGQLKVDSVDDVYSLDQKLTAFIDPPNEIKQFLGEERWYIRDSNWNPDFSLSAKQMGEMIEKSTGKQIDGVLALNIGTVSELLGVLEQLSLPEYNEVLTARNVHERMEFYSEIQLVNETNKPEYSELVLQKLLAALIQLPEEKAPQLLSVLEKAVSEKELLVYFSRSGEQSTMDLLGWSGALVQPSCPAVFSQQNCITDSLFQVEANVGVNKANYYLQRQVDHRVEVLPDQIRHKRVITLKNTAQSNAWPKGAYRSYTRFYVDPTAQLSSIMVGGQPMEPSQIISTQENGRLVWGVVTETPIKSETTIELVYSLPHSQQRPFTYVFFDQKQPGAREVSPRVFMSYDTRLSPTVIAPQAEVQGNVIVFSPSRDTGHMFVGATFQ